jgi:hypothetical protein
MDYDLLVIGVSARRHWKKFVFGPTQDKIVQNAKCPVLIYERVAGSELTKRPTESNKRDEIDR